MNEEELLDWLNKTFERLQLVKTKDKCCRWDAENANYVVELKARRAHYDTQIIEWSKYEAVTEEAESSGRRALYVASTPEEILIFDLTQLGSELYRFNWENKYLPATTDFGSTQKITKKVGFIENEKAKRRLKNEGTNRQRQSDL